MDNVRLNSNIEIAFVMDDVRKYKDDKIKISIPKLMSLSSTNTEADNISEPLDASINANAQNIMQIKTINTSNYIQVEYPTYGKSSYAKGERVYIILPNMDYNNIHIIPSL